MSVSNQKIRQCSVLLNKTFTHHLKNINFDNLNIQIINKILKDGRPFSHFIEPWLQEHYNIKHVEGCKDHDFIDINYSDTKYDEKTFTKNGCKFCPSSMLGTGRKFNKELFEEKAKKLVYIIVSNVNFPEIKIKFVDGPELLKLYPKGEIPFKNHNQFFNHE